MFSKEATAIIQVLENYFEGVYTGNIDLLASVFHPQTFLYGDVNEEPYMKNVADYLEVVRNRQSPQSLGEAKKMKIISIETQGMIAFAKVSMPVFAFNYIDYLSLAKINGQWVIVNKLLTNAQTV